MMLEQVKNLAHHMRLFGLHAACDRRAQEALAQQLHPLEFLRLLLEDEVLSRQDRTAKALTTKARFRFRADLEDWDASFHTDPPKATLAELATLSFFHNRENLVLLGKTGVGKTCLAIALGKRLCHEGHAVSPRELPVRGHSGGQSSRPVPALCPQSHQSQRPHHR